MLEKVHQLQQDLITLKSSQAIGSSSSRIIRIAHFDESGNMKNTHYVIGVFKSNGIINPLVTPRLEVSIDGQTPSVGLSYPLTNWAFLSYDDLALHVNLIRGGTNTSQLFDEYTTGFMVELHHNGYRITKPFSVVGDLYASCEGTLTMYNFDDPEAV